MSETEQSTFDISVLQELWNDLFSQVCQSDLLRDLHTNLFFRLLKTDPLRISGLSSRSKHIEWPISILHVLQPTQAKVRAIHVALGKIQEL